MPGPTQICPSPRAPRPVVEAVGHWEMPSQGPWRDALSWGNRRASSAGTREQVFLNPSVTLRDLVTFGLGMWGNWGRRTEGRWDPAPYADII